MDVATSRFADVIVAAPVGRIDHTTADSLESQLAPFVAEPGAGPASLLLDFTDVEYISSVGLRVLMLAARQVRARQARIAVAALQPVVHEIFAISRFNQVLEVFPTVRGTLTAISPGALAAFDAAGAGGGA